MRIHLALALLAALICYVMAAPRRPFRGPAMGRVPNHEGPHHRRPKPVICKFNATRLDIEYDVPCDLPEYFECVEGKPPRPRPPFGRRPGGSHEGPGVGGPGFDGSAIFGERPVFDGDHSSTTRYFPEEGPRCHAEMGFCRQKTCTSNGECGDFPCIDGRCNITRDVHMYAAACNVTDESGTMIKERKCLGECGTRGRDIVYKGKNLIAYFCRPPHPDDALLINIETQQDWGTMADIWFFLVSFGGVDGANSSDEEDGFDLSSFVDESVEDGSDEWSSGDVNEDDFRPFGGEGGRPFSSEFPEFPGNGESFPGGRPDQERPTPSARPERPTSGGNQGRPTSGDNQDRPTSGDNQEHPTSGDNQERPTSGGNQERPTSGGGRPQPPPTGGRPGRPNFGGRRQ